MARAFAYGFSHHNFYMLTGGSNFGFSAAWGVTTAYAPDTAIDFLLLRHEPKFSTVKAFNAALTSVSAELLGNAPPAAPTRVGRFCEYAAYGADLVFVSNTGLNASATETVTVAGQQLLMPNHTVVILGKGGALIFNTSAAPDALPPRGPAAPSTQSRSAPPVWSTIVEHVGFGNKTAAPAVGAPPLEMLALTRNAVDYMYFTLRDAAVPVNASELAVSTCGGEYVYVFVGASAESAVALPRAQLPAGADARARNTHAFALPHRAGPTTAATTVYILVSAMGLSTSPSPGSCKGVRKVEAGGTDLTNAGWVSSWVFAGEAAQVFTPAGAAAATWSPVAADGGAVPTSWFKALFDMPPAPAPAPAPSAPGSEYPAGAPPQLAYALDLAGATKGVAYVNGFNIGRYDLELGVCNGPCAPPIHGGQCYIFWRNCGLPTQRYYHVPTSLLQPTGNLVVLFEEASNVPTAGQGPVAPSPPPAALGAAQQPAGPLRGAPRDLSNVALVALTDHP